MQTILNRPLLNRLAAISLLSLLFALAFNEITYLFQKEATDRPPQTRTIVIPLGAAARLQAGEQVLELPEEMVFVVGDVLEVKNEDLVSHQLGPIWVPPGSSGRLTLNQAQKFTMSCSFQPGGYLGLDVRPATTWGTRFIALLLTAPTLAALLFLYSLAAFPLNASSKRAAS